MDTQPKKLPGIGKKKGSRPTSQQEDRKPSKESRHGSKDTRKGSKESVQSRRASLLLHPPVKLIKTAAQAKKEAEELLAQRDPFEDWRRNMVSGKHMTHFQRQLKTNEGLESLQGGLKDEAQKFKNFWIKELDSDSLYENRLKFGPSGMKVQASAEKKKEAFKAAHWSPTEEGQMRSGTNRDLFNYFNTQVTAEEPSVANLSKLLGKSHTYGANLDKLAKDEQKRQLAENRRLRAEKLRKDASPRLRKRREAAKTDGVFVSPKMDGVKAA